MSCGCIDVQEATVPLESLMRFVAAVIPDIPYEVGLEFLRQAYIEFGRRTSLLATDFDIQTQAEVKEYPLEAPEGYTVFGIMQRAPDAYGYILFPNAFRWFMYAGQSMRMVGNDRIVFESAPTTNDRIITVSLHLLPDDCCDTIPSEIATPYGMGIAKGAIAELLEMPGKKWSDPRSANRYRAAFMNTILSGRNLHLTNRGANKVMMDQIRVL